MSEESNHKSYVRQFGQRPRVDSELGVLPNIVSCTTYGEQGSVEPVCDSVRLRGVDHPGAKSSL